MSENLVKNSGEKYKKHIGVYDNEDSMSSDVQLTAPWISCIETPDPNGGPSTYSVHYSSTPVVGVNDASEIIKMVQMIKQEKVYLSESQYEELVANPDKEYEVTDVFGNTYRMSFNSAKNDKLFLTYENPE